MPPARVALITGITGQDGSYLAELLLDKGYEVHGLVRRCSAPTLGRIAHLADRLTLHAGDLLDQSSLGDALEAARPDEVYNLAAMSFVTTSFVTATATGEYTGLGVTRLLEMIRRADRPIRFYQASSSEMYGAAREVPQNELTPFHPRSPYGTAKLYGHFATVNFRESYGLHASSGILFNHESPRRGMEFVTRRISRGVAEIRLGLRDVLTLGNLNARRDWGFAGDYVRAMWLMLQQPQPGDFVIATGTQHSVAEFVATAFAHVGIDDWHPYVQIDEGLLRPAEVDLLLGDASRARQQLGWAPTVGFGDLVAMMVDHDLAELSQGSVPLSM